MIVGYARCTCTGVIFVCGRPSLKWEVDDRNKRRPIIKDPHLTLDPKTNCDSCGLTYVSEIVMRRPDFNVQPRD